MSSHGLQLTEVWGYGFELPEISRETSPGTLTTLVTFFDPQSETDVAFNFEGPLAQRALAWITATFAQSDADSLPWRESGVDLYELTVAPFDRSDGEPGLPGVTIELMTRDGTTTDETVSFLPKVKLEDVAPLIGGVEIGGGRGTAASESDLVVIVTPYIVSPAAEPGGDGSAPPQVVPGDTVLFAKYGGTEIRLEGEGVAPGVLVRLLKGLQDDTDAFFFSGDDNLLFDIALGGADTESVRGGIVTPDATEFTIQDFEVSWDGYSYTLREAIEVNSFDELADTFSGLFTSEPTWNGGDDIIA